jgi:diadenylate cyclase
MMLLLVRIGFLEMRWVDALDILLVGLLLYALYRVLRGSLAYNLFIGLLLAYLLSLVFQALEMQMMSRLLGQFSGVGLLALLIVFQPEARRFLLYLGRGSVLHQNRFFRRFSQAGKAANAEGGDPESLRSMHTSLLRMADRNIGALVVFTQTSRLDFFADTGVRLDAELSGELLESIFQRSSPLHDGAVIISAQRVQAAACILPVSEATELPAQLGLRHRAAVGITEHSDATALVISEEGGSIAFARDGKLQRPISSDQLLELLRDLWQSTYSA